MGSQAAVLQPSLLQRSLNPKLSKLGTHGKKNIIFKSVKRVAWRGNRKLWFGCLFSAALQTIPQKDSISPLSGWSDLRPEGWWGTAEIPECYQGGLAPTASLNTLSPAPIGRAHWPHSCTTWVRPHPRDWCMCSLQRFLTSWLPCDKGHSRLYRSFSQNPARQAHLSPLLIDG